MSDSASEDSDILVCFVVGGFTTVIEILGLSSIIRKICTKKRTNKQEKQKKKLIKHENPMKLDLDNCL